MQTQQTSNFASNFTPALICGAGPVGLVMAAELMRYGVECRIIDKAPEPTRVSKALALHARSLEVFEDMGVLEPFLDEGLRLEGAHIYDKSQELAHIRFDHVDLSDLPYPFGILLPQSHTERILLAHLAKSGVGVERPKELVNFTQDADGITVMLQSADGTSETVRTHWLLGCDGAGSTVRQLVGETFHGETYKEVFWVADVVMNTSLPASEIHSVLHPDGMMMIFPLFPERRLYRIAADVAIDVPEGTRPSAPTLAEMQEIARVRSPFPVEFSSMEWASGFRIHHRKISRYRHGRVFLAGDAAHIHSPMGGQGMNTGIQDAYNLAWKLALVEKGKGKEALLESYHAEREPIAASLLAATDRMTRMAKTRNPLVQKIRNKVVPMLAGTDLVKTKLLRGMTEVELAYPESPIVREDWRGGKGEIQAGDRAPDATLFNARSNRHERLFEVFKDTRTMILLFSGTKPEEKDIRGLKRIARELREEYHAVADVRYIVAPSLADSLIAGLHDDSTPIMIDIAHEAHERYEATAQCLYVIRPDGYIAYRSLPADIEDVIAFLQINFK
jgi:2-polyprenyl-6-methoxyphenol hydroxylase-like FAD-dependent oxidoreductase